MVTPHFSDLATALQVSISTVYTRIDSVYYCLRLHESVLYLLS